MVRGRLRGSRPLLHRGWNLIGPVVDIPEANVRPPRDTAGHIWHWDPDSRGHHAVPNDGTLLPGKAYWFYVLAHEGCVIQFGE